MTYRYIVRFGLSFELSSAYVGRDYNTDSTYEISSVTDIADQFIGALFPKN